MIRIDLFAFPIIGNRVTPRGCHSFITALLYACLLLCLSATSSHADDIDVFTPNVISGSKPNVLLVLDYSSSMKKDVNGDDPAVSGLPSRMDILRSAMFQFLDNNVSSLKVGYISFGWNTTGIRWPATDMDVYANSLDPDIPLSESHKVIDVLKIQMDAQWIGPGTSTVPALVEAALYFQGGPVTLGGVNRTNARFWEPNKWSTYYNKYSGDHDYMANPISFEPRDAFRYNEPNGAVGECYDFTVGGTVAGANNECASVTQPLTCVFNAASTWTNESGVQTRPANNYCTYEYPDHWAGANYVPPESSECSRNIILLISDGEPENGDDFPEKELILGHHPDQCEDLSQTIFSGKSNVGKEANCAIEIAKRLSTEDQIPGVKGSKVITHTIGFNSTPEGEAFLERVASAGGGEAHVAYDLEGLNKALKAIVGDFGNDTQTFSPLAVDVNRATFSHNNRAFISLFKPGTGNAWRGNLKGYFLDENGLVDINGAAATVNTGGVTLFSNSAQSFWSAVPDGANVEAGGASGKLDGATRRLYTFTGSRLSDHGASLVTSGGEHDLTTGNSALSNAQLGVSTATERDALIDWIRNAPMGDALHSQSVTVEYGSRTVVYAMTNQGLFHAFDATMPSSAGEGDTSGGNELFAFMPPALLPNLRYLTGALTPAGHIYGLDGQITRWHEDANGDGIVNGHDTVMLVFGQRRGGKNYYALDVTNPERPVYKWKIEGGVAPFGKLAQSWSDMSLVTVNYAGEPKRVLVFGGGYDASVNDVANGAAKASGNSIFMVNADGKLLWSADAAGMDYSIPSDLTIIDASDDGLADRIYVGDLGGNIWRVDISDAASAASIQTTKFASLGDATHQPFFYPPAVSMESATKTPYLSVAIGSGNRANPLQTGSSNRIFALRDKAVEGGSPAEGFQTITTSDLYNATDNLIGSSDPDVVAGAREKLKNSSGWYVNLATSEKVLSAVSVFEGRLLTTTMTPEVTVVAGSCSGAQVSGNYYSMAVRDAVPMLSTKSSNRLPEGVSSTASGDRKKTIRVDGIPNTPQVLSLPGSASANIMVDQEVVDTIVPDLHQVFWFAE